MIYSSFPEKKDEPKVWTFRPTLTTRFLLKMAEMEKNITSTVGGGTSAIGLSKYVKIKALSPFIFSGKARLLFCNIWTGFSNLAAFLGTTPIFLEKNELDYLMKISMINRLATISNPKSEKAKTSYALF